MTFSFRNPLQNSEYTSLFANACHMPHPSSSPWIWRYSRSLNEAVPTTKLLIVQFSPAFCCILRPRPEWSDSFPLQAYSYKNSTCCGRQDPFLLMKLESRTTEVLSPLSAHAWLYVFHALLILMFFFLFSVIFFKTDLEQRNGDTCL